jgi:hypothetical protein
VTLGIAAVQRSNVESEWKVPIMVNIHEPRCFIPWYVISYYTAKVSVPISIRKASSHCFKRDYVWTS